MSYPQNSQQPVPSQSGHHGAVGQPGQEPRAPQYFPQMPQGQKPAKVKKPLLKRWWFWAIVIVAFIVIVTNLGGGGGDETTATSASQEQADTKPAAEDTDVDEPVAAAPAEDAPAEDEAPEDEAPAEEAPVEAEPEIPAEHTSALSQAETYSDTMHMSKAGVFEQLTSEYGGQFSEEAAQYAVDNVDADWKQNALESAQTYQDDMAMSPDAIHDQLTSEYGGQFTQAEADYAIDNLNG